MPTDLERELRALDERTTKLAETDDLPRSKLPALFRALRAAATVPEESGRLLEAAGKLGARLADRGLLESIAELARDVEALRAPLLAALQARAAAPDAWTIEKQARLLSTEGSSLLDALAKLAADPPAIDLPADKAIELVDARLASSRRDRTSVDVTRGALRLLARHARDPRVTVLAARMIEAETRRAGKEEPELALVALELLAGAEPLALLRAAKTIEKRVDRKKIRDRASELAQEAVTALGASREDVADLLADDLGLDAAGVLRIPLEEGEALVSIDRTGAVKSSSARPLAADDRREVEAAVAQVARARRDHAERLERALGTGRAWRLAIFRAVFLGHPLLRDVASRLVWIALPSRIAFRPTAAGATPGAGATGLEDVFSGPVGGFAEDTLVRVAHPLELDPEELALWRERLPEIGRQPFPQLHRLVRKETEPLGRFVGRELYQEDMAELGRRRGYRGLPLRGDGPWELARDLPGFGAVIAITLDRVAGQVIVTKRKDALRVFDDPEAKPRERRDAAPRAKVARVEIVVAGAPPGGPGDVPLAEAALDLHALTDPLEAGTDAFFGDWQKKKFKDPAAAWREAQLRMMRGSQAAVEVRAALVRAFAPRTRIEGRLAIAGGDDGLYVDLGTRQAFEGPLRDWVPPWRLDERVKAPELDWPFEPAHDEDTVRTVATAVGASRVVDSAASQEKT